MRRGLIRNSWILEQNTGMAYMVVYDQQGNQTERHLLDIVLPIDCKVDIQKTNSSKLIAIIYNGRTDDSSQLILNYIVLPQ